MAGLSDRIKALRERVGKSQREMGIKIFPDATPNAGQKLISRIEDGKRELAASELYRFAAYFGVHPDWLMFGDASPRQNGSDSGWTEDLRSLCRDVKLVMESGDHITAMALRQNIAAFKESVLRKTKIDGKQEVATSDSQDPRPGKDVPTTAAAGESSGKKKAM